MKIKIEEAVLTVVEDGEIRTLTKGVNVVSDYIGNDLVNANLAKAVAEKAEKTE